MDFKALLNQVMVSGSDLAAQGSRQVSQQLKQSSGQSQQGMSDMTKGAIGGALGGSLLTMLVGSKKGRKMGKKAAKLGGTAALGALAYKVFNDWQASSSQQVSQNTTSQNTGFGQASAGYQGGARAVSGQNSMASVSTEQSAMVILKAMIAAAKADGHVDNVERQKIHDVIVSLGATAEVSAFVDSELGKPLDPKDVALGVSCSEQAAEIYLASVAMVDEQNFMEKAYLKELANQLGLPQELTMRLEAQLA